MVSVVPSLSSVRPTAVAASCTGVSPHCHTWIVLSSMVVVSMGAAKLTVAAKVDGNPSWVLSQPRSSFSAGDRSSGMGSARRPLVASRTMSLGIGITDACGSKRACTTSGGGCRSSEQPVTATATTTTNASRAISLLPKRASATL